MIETVFVREWLYLPVTMIILYLYSGKWHFRIRTVFTAIFGACGRGDSNDCFRFPTTIRTCDGHGAWPASVADATEFEILLFFFFFANYSFYGFDCFILYKNISTILILQYHYNNIIMLLCEKRYIFANACHAPMWNGCRNWTPKD